MTHAPPRLTTAGRIVLLGLLALAAAACDDESAKSGVDLGPEVAADAGGDGMRAQFGDAARDASSDAMMDATVDGIDAMVDGGAEKAFDPARLIEVRVEIAPADWDALRVEGRSWGEVLRPDCQDAPSPSPYHWYHGTVTVDGEVFGDVAVRKKGFLGSLSATRPSLKIKLDEYVPDQAFRGLDRLTLNNGRQDPSAIRTCLAYSMFARAGVPTPRCSMAHVTVNGVDLGVYAHVEAVKKPFLRAHFNDDEGWLYEGNLSDFRDGWTDTFEQKTREDVPYRAPLDRVVAALDAPDETLFAALDAVLDLDAFFTFWATEVLIAHWDGYAGDLNNFLVYADADTERLRFIPWGPDAAFEPPRLLTEGVPAPRSVFAVGALARRLYLHPEGRARFLARLRTLHDTLWDVPGLQAEAEAWGAVAAQAVPEAARARHAIAVAEVGAFIAEQDAAVTADLDAGGVDWVLPLRGPICVQPAGDAAGTFATTWGSWPTDNAFVAGMGTLAGTFRGDPVAPERVAAAAGIEDGRPLLLVPAVLPGDIVVYIAFRPRPDQVTPGEIGLDPTFECALYLFDAPTGRSTFLASCPAGTLTFTEAATSPGAPVRGRFDVELWATNWSR